MDFKNLFKSVLKGLARGLILSLILLAVLSGVMFFKELSSKVLNIALSAITCLSIVYGSAVATNRNGKNGWLVGMILGGFYFLIIFIFSSLLLKSNSDFGVLNFAKLIIFMVTGMFSGMLAINM